MNDLTIRRFAALDSEAIADLIAAYRAEDHARSVDRDAIVRSLRECSTERDAIFVAESGGEIVGYVAAHWVPFPLLEGWEAYVSDLIVAHSRRGAGVGGRLVAEVETAARGRGCVRLMLNNAKTAASFARGFYPKHGFRERDEFGNFVKPLR